MIFEHPERFLAESYPDCPAKMQHRLVDSELFTLDKLLDLSRKLPKTSIEYNAGNLDLDQDPNKTPANGLSPEETIQRIEHCNSWLVIKNIEQVSAYAEFLSRSLREIESASGNSTGPMYRKEGFVFLSSPNAVTPFHMDPEHNILMQIAGRKDVSIFPANDYQMISPELHEAFHADGHRNLPYLEEYAQSAQTIRLEPGDAVYIPVKAPHHVKVGSEVSISLSVTWRSRLSDRDAHIHHMNRILRKWGAWPAPPGRYGNRDSIKVVAHRLLERLSRMKLIAQMRFWPWGRYD